MKSVMTHSFSQVPSANIPRSQFNRSHGIKKTIQAGRLYPFFVDDVLPGDTFNLRTSGFCRLSTPIFPVMDNMFLETFYFFVPNRLVWDNWVKLMGEQENPGDSTDFLVPQIEAPGTVGFNEDTIYDHMGINPKAPGVFVNALPFRAINLIWNEWFRDQNLQDSKEVPKGDGPDNNNFYDLWRRGKRHDYFTSCLPWPQKGPDINLPIGDTAPVVPDPATDGAPSFTHTSFPGGDTFFMLNQGASNIDNNQWTPSTLQSQETVSWQDPKLQADLTTATGVTINEMRTAFQIQKMYERDARGGTRYIEMNLAHFGVRSPDARLQRPEYLGGGSTPVTMEEIHATSDVTSVGGSLNLGDLSGIGRVGFNGHGFNKSFTEHGWVIGLVNVRADITYQYGINRMYHRRERFDHYFPAFAGLGEQEVRNKEIFAQGNADPAADDAVFGFQERWAEYRYKPSEIHGQFRSNHSTPLDAWHLSQEFDNLPVLDETFIQDAPPINRVIAVPSEPHFICDFYHKLYCARPMPMFGVPGNIDRF